jgi:hypothetical protein
VEAWPTLTVNEFERALSRLGSLRKYVEIARTWRPGDIGGSLELQENPVDVATLPQVTP